MTSGQYKKTPEHCKNLSLARKGIVFSDEHRRKLSLSHLGHKPIISKETYKIIAEKNRGKKRSEETKAKLRISRARQIIKPLPLASRIKMSNDRKGDKWYTWKGGITPINSAIRSSFEYKLWREAVFKRDNWTCVWCGIKGHKGLGKTVILHADHIKPFCNYPSLRFAIDNGRTLCKECHKKTNTYGPKANNK